MLINVAPCGWERAHVIFCFISMAKVLRSVIQAIDSDLNFDEHVSEVIRNVSKQLRVLKRHKHLISTRAKKRLCDAFLLSSPN